MRHLVLFLQIYQKKKKNFIFFTNYFLVAPPPFLCFFFQNLFVFYAVGKNIKKSNITNL